MKNETVEFAFVVLHYYALDETIKCIESIRQKHGDYSYKIIAVDNGSPNGTGAELKKMYGNDEDVVVILSDANLGFAKGNNLGFEYAKKNLDVNFILLLNNDIVFTQEDFCKRIVNEYEHSNFAVLGPKIVLSEGDYESYSSEPITLKDLKKNLKVNKIKLILTQLGVYSYLVAFKSKMTRKSRLSRPNPERKEMIVLHGSCLIFSRKYIDLFDGLDSRTFMYSEEQFLYWRLIDNNLLSVFNPEIEIFHSADQSTKKSLKTRRNMYRFILSNQIKSDIILKSDIERREK